MCLEIDRNKHEYDSETCSYKPKIAQSDFYVYKIGRVKEDKFYPVFQFKFEYLKNEETEYVELKQHRRWLGNDCYQYNVIEGYHSFMSDGYCQDYINYIKRINVFTFSDSIYQSQRFLIKKGTEYFIGNNNDIVSSKIIWVPENEK